MASVAVAHTGIERLTRHANGRVRYDRSAYRGAVSSTWYTPRGTVARKLFTTFGREWTYLRYVYDADGYLVGKWIGFGPTGLAAYRARQYRAVTDWHWHVVAARATAEPEQRQDEAAAYQQLGLFEARDGAREVEA